MTFEQWQAARIGPLVFTEEQAGVYEGQRGYSYEAGFILAQDDGAFHVPLPQPDPVDTFATLSEAEAYLWREWCDGEINGPPSN